MNLDSIFETKTIIIIAGTLALILILSHGYVNLTKINIDNDRIKRRKEVFDLLRHLINKDNK